MNALGGEGVTGFNVYSLLVAIGGAILTAVPGQIIPQVSIT
jgi:hypothetical protein